MNLFVFYFTISDGENEKYKNGNANIQKNTIIQVPYWVWGGLQCSELWTTSEGAAGWWHNTTHLNIIEVFTCVTIYWM